MINILISAVGLTFLIAGLLFLVVALEERDRDLVVNLFTGVVLIAIGGMFLIIH